MSITALPLFVFVCLVENPPRANVYFEWLLHGCLQGRLISYLTLFQTKSKNNKSKVF